MSSFDESLGCEEVIDPNQIADFDWDSLLARLDGTSPDELTQDDGLRVAAALRAILQWSIDGWGRMRGGDKFTPLEVIGRRLLILAWSVDPEIIASGGASIRQIADQLGCSAAILSDCDVRRVRETFGLRNVYAAHDWRRKSSCGEPRHQDETEQQEMRSM